MTEHGIEQLPWNDVMAVGIRTTADGPFAEDLFWQFLFLDRVVELPGTLVTGELFTALGEHLPGIDWRKATQATGSTDARIFSVWDRDAPVRPDGDALRARFAALVTRLGGGAAAASAAFERLSAAWSARDRHYHDLDHLRACLHALDGANVEPATADVVELALWYHDAIYEPGGADCEQRSAQWLVEDAAGLAIPARTVRRAAELVRATASHQPPGPHGDLATDLIADIDLSILGRNVFCFMDYEYGVAEEYAAIPPLAFRIARGRFLASLLASPSIYRTEHFRARYERQARRQIANLLTSSPYRAYRWLRWLPIGRR